LSFKFQVKPKEEAIMALKKMFIGRRQFLAAAGIGSASALAIGKLGRGFQATPAMAAGKTASGDTNAVSDRYKHILSPLKIGNVVLKNRFFLPPSVPHFLQGPELFPSDELRAYYIHLARNGAGLISVRIMGDRGSRKEQFGDSAHMIMWDIEDPGVQNYLEQLVEGIHVFGAKACASIRVSSGSGPSGAQGRGAQAPGGAPGQGGAPPGGGMPEGMPEGGMPPQGGTPGGTGGPGGMMSQSKTYTDEEVQEMCEATVKQGKVMQNHGFDALQLGIRGNHSVSLALCKAAKSAMPDMLVVTEIFVRENQITAHTSDQYYQSAVPLDEAIAYAKQLEGAADIVHVRIGDASAGHATSWNSIKGKPYSIAYAEAIKKSGAKIIVAPGAGYQDLDLNEEYIASGKADMITAARAFICDSEYGKKMASGRGEDVVPCIRCNKCHGVSMNDTWFTVCSVNPKIGLPLAVKAIEAPTVQKKVAVVGGGVSGMKAAVVAAERGHQVTLYEKDATLGGLARHSDYSPYKWCIKGYKDYLVKQMEKSGVEVKLKTEATPAMIKAGGYDTVLAAVGSDPAMSKMPGADSANVFNIMDAYRKEQSMGRNVVVIGGGEYGADVGIFLAGAGHNVTVLTSERALLQEQRVHYTQVLEETYADLENFSIITRGTPTAITAGKVAYKDAQGTEQTLKADSVVLHSGLKPKKTEALAFYDSAKQFFTVGDCSEKGGNIQRCTRSAYFAASEV